MVKEASSYTAMYQGRVQKDKRHTAVQINEKTEKEALFKLVKSLKDLGIKIENIEIEHVNLK